MAIDQRHGHIQVAGTLEIDRQAMPRGLFRDDISAGHARVESEVFTEHETDSHCAGGSFPFRDGLAHRRIFRVDRPHDGEAVRMRALYFHRVAGVEAVHASGRYRDSAIHADCVHGHHHFIGGDLATPIVMGIGPGALR